MKSIFENTIFIIAQIIMLVIAILWYLECKEKEPLIAIVAIITTIIVTLFFRLKEKKEDENSHIINIEGNNNISIQNSTKSEININKHPPKK